MVANRLIPAAATAALLVGLLSGVRPVYAADCESNAQAGHNALGVFATCQTPETTPNHAPDKPASANDAPTLAHEDWEPLCVPGNQFEGCETYIDCPPGTYIALHHVTLSNGLQLATSPECHSDAATPTVTPATVATAFASLPLPHLTSLAQPAGKTLVNFDTVFHVEAELLTRSLTLLGQRVELRITPNSFRWVFGDGETTTTTTPGAAYPARTIVHRYQRAGSVRQHVEVTWTARWSLNGGAFQEVPGSVSTTGPASALQVVEATPNLSGG